MTGLSPTQLSLRHMRADGWTAAVVEVWNPHARIRQDLFNIADILAVRGPDTLAVQTTTAGNTSARCVRRGGGSSCTAGRNATAAGNSPRRSIARD